MCLQLPFFFVPFSLLLVADIQPILPHLASFSFLFSLPLLPCTLMSLLAPCPLRVCLCSQWVYLLWANDSHNGLMDYHIMVYSSPQITKFPTPVHWTIEFFFPTCLLCSYSLCFNINSSKNYGHLTVLYILSLGFIDSNFYFNTYRSDPAFLFCLVSLARSTMTSA